MNKATADKLITELNQLDHNMRAQLSTMAKAHERLEKDFNANTQMFQPTRNVISGLLDIIQASNAQLEWHITKLHGILDKTK